MTDAELLSELDDDPAGLGYADPVADRRDGDIAALLNDKGHATLPYEVTGPTLLKLGVGVPGLRKTIEDNVGNSDPQKASVALTIKDMIVSGRSLDLTDPAIYSGNPNSPGILEALIGWGWVDAAGYAAIVAAGSVPASRAEVLDGVGNTVPVDQVSRVLNERASTP